MWGAVAVHSPAIVAAPAGFVPGVAVTLWLELLGVACAVLAVSGALAWWQHRRAAPAPSVWRRRARRLTADDLARLLAEVDSLSQHATTAVAAATDAEFAVARAQGHCRNTQRARELAWHEYDTAQRAYANALRNPAMGEDVWPMVSTSGAWPVLVAGGSEPASSPHGDSGDVGGARESSDGGGGSAGTALAVSRSPAAAPVPYPDDEPVVSRDLSRAALAAYRRGDISVEQLREVFRHFSGWDGRHERHEREVLRRRAAEREAHRRYNAAAAAERIANDQADVAAAAARAWAEEAVEATEEARIARVFVNECLRHAAIRRRLRRLGP
jgi:hypothetical protein